MPKFTLNGKNILVENGQHVSVSFVIPVIIGIHGHRFKIYTLVSEIHDNVDKVLGIKNVSKIEGVINTRESCKHFLNILIPFSPNRCNIKTKGREFISTEAPFIDELSGMTMVKLLDLKGGSVNAINVTIIRNLGLLDVTNNSSEQLIFNEMNHWVYWILDPMIDVMFLYSLAK